MKAGIVVDDWKLPVFMRNLTNEGYAYTDSGAMTSDTTLLTVETTDLLKLRKVLKACQKECAEQNR